MSYLEKPKGHAKFLQNTGTKLFVAESRVKIARCSIVGLSHQNYQCPGRPRLADVEVVAFHKRAPRRASTSCRQLPPVMTL